MPKIHFFLLLENLELNFAFSKIAKTCNHVFRPCK